MANRFPLILDTTDGNKIKEIPAGDNLDLRNVSIVDAQDIDALGTINAAAITINGNQLQPGTFTDLDDTPSTYTGFEGYLVRVNADGTGLDYIELGGEETELNVSSLNISGNITPVTTLESDLGSTSRKFNEIHANITYSSIRAFDGSTFYDATTNQIPYAVIAGRPLNLSDLNNDEGYITADQLKATLPEVLGEDLTIEVNQTGNLIGSVFGEDSTVLVDHINSRINAARLTQNGAADGQTIVWNGETEVWEPGIAGDITGLSSDKIDTLTVETGYKFTFADNPGLIEAAGLRINTTSDPIDLDGDTRIIGNRSLYPENSSSGYVGTSTNVFFEGNFDTVNSTKFVGELEGTSVTTVSRSDTGVFGDKAAGNAGYQLHVLGELGITSGNIWMNGGNINGANLFNTTGDLTGSVFGDDSTVLVDAVNNTLSGDLQFQTSVGYVRGETIAIIPVNTVDIGNVRALGNILPENDNSGLVGSTTKRFSEGNFAALNADSLSVDSFATDNFSTTNFTISGTGVGEVTSSTDVIISVGNRARVEGGPLRLERFDQAGADLIAAQVGDAIYNTDDNRFQFFQNGSWINLHQGTFEGDVIGSIFADGSTQIFDGVSGKLISPTVSGPANFENDIVVQGNLTVSGTTTSVNTTNTTLKDNVITLNQGETGAGVTLGSAGIEIDRGSEADVRFTFAENADRWTTNGIPLETGSLVGAAGLQITTDGGLANELISIQPGGSDTFIRLTANNIIFQGNVIQPINATAGVVGDITGSIFGDDSTPIIDSVNNKVLAPVDTTTVTAQGVTTNEVSRLDGGTLQILSGAGGSILMSGTTIDINGPISAPQGVTTDLVGSVFGDDSTVLIDGNNSKIVGPIETSSHIVFKTPNNINGINAINSATNQHSILMNEVGSLSISSTLGVSLLTDADSAINIGTGSSGTINIGNGSSNTFIFGSLNGTLTGNVIGNVSGTVTGALTGDVTGSVFADSSTQLIDGVAGTIVGPLKSTDGVNSVTMGANLQLVSTGGVEIQGAASATVEIGGGTSGGVVIGTGTNEIRFNGQTGNTPVDGVNVSEWLEVNVNGNTRYIPLYA